MIYFIMFVCGLGLLGGILWGIALGYRSCAKRVMASNDIGDNENTYIDVLEKPTDLRVLSLQSNIDKSQYDYLVKSIR